jgi:branched-chain amino acid transport system permease protein
MHAFVQLLVLGTAIGGVYALMGVGLNLIFGVMRVANLAHGALYMLGGYAGFFAVSETGLPLPVGILAALLVGGAAGWLTNAVLLRPVYRTRRLERPSEFTLIVTFALSLAASSGATIFFSTDFRRVPGLWPVDLNFGGWALINGDRLVAFGVAVLLVALLMWVVHFTDIGRGWRALTQNPLGAEVVGIDTFRLANLAFAASGALAAAGGAVLVPVYLAYPTMGSSVIVKSFVVVVLGGLGSIGGSLVGGFLLAWAEAFGAVYIDPAYTEIYGLGIMLLVLLVMPNGLFGRAARAV